MKAFAITSADQPAALVDLPVPAIADDGALVRVRAASVNGFDVYQAGGALMAMMPHELPTVIGRDLAGVVESVGSARTDVAVGDEVLGFVTSTPPLNDGTYAELVAGGSGLILARKPAGPSWEVAAAIPLAGATALDSVDAVQPGPGDTVLVVGATGGVGSIALQLAAQRGATVIATAKAGDEEAFARSLGAADVPALAARNVAATNVMGAPTREKLTSLADRVAAGTLEVRIQRTFPLTEAPAALAAFMAGTLGKIVLTIT